MKKILFLFLLISLPAHALDVPPLEGRINDRAHILSTETITQLTQKLADFEAKTSNQIAVLTIPSLEGEVLEEYSLRVVSTWKLGQADKDNGVLLLIAKSDRKIRIEVGYGLEADLTDFRCQQIIRNEITPEFRNQNFDQGITKGLTAIMNTIQHSYQPQAYTTTKQVDPMRYIIGTLFLVLVIGFFTVMALSASGCASWFLYFFLMPFWAVSLVFVGKIIGAFLLTLFVIGFPILKIWMGHSTTGYNFQRKLEKFSRAMNSGSSRFGGRSSSGGGFSGGGFSGGGGSFGGGGSSGGW